MLAGVAINAKTPDSEETGVSWSHSFDLERLRFRQNTAQIEDLFCSVGGYRGL
jgi:hypothetical protein